MHTNQSTSCTSTSFPKVDFPKGRMINTLPTNGSVPAKQRGTSAYIHLTEQPVILPEQAALKCPSWKLSDINEQHSQHHGPINLSSANKDKPKPINWKWIALFSVALNILEKDLGQVWIENGPKGYPQKAIPKEISECIKSWKNREYLSVFTFFSRFAFILCIDISFSISQKTTMKKL